MTERPPADALGSPADLSRARLRHAAAAFGRRDYQLAAEEALRALDLHDRNGDAWFVLGAARAQIGDLETALAAYQAALQLMPQRPEIANELGQLAFRLHRVAEAVDHFARYYAAFPEREDASNNLANALREQHEFEAAIEVLRPAIEANPASALLWNSLGVVLEARGDPAGAVPFFTEALRLGPQDPTARLNLAVARAGTGDFEGALLDCDAGLASAPAPADAARLRLTRSTALFCLGRIGEGWDDYEARLDPAHPGAAQFMIDRPRWDLEQDPAGRSLLLFGEQGLGDQIRFANIIPDLVRALGPDGRLTVAVEDRLLPLFRRGFPGIEFVPLVKTTVNGRSVRFLPDFDAETIDLWTPMASPMRRFRRTLADFPPRPRTLAADPGRTAHWRRTLEALPGLKAGLLWKSLTMVGARSKFFAEFEQWGPVLRTPGVTFVNLQYGDAAEELAQARRRMGVDVWTPPGVDLRDDLDEVAALTCAVDLLIAPDNATSNIAAACGADTWFVTTPAAWPRLGADGYPWYPQARAFTRAALGPWDEVLERVALALGRAAASVEASP